VLLWTIGDSWTDPYFWDVGPNGWPAQVAADLGLELVNNGAGGAGYVNVAPLPTTFPHEAVDRPAAGADVAVVFGSVNDQAQAPIAVHLAALVTYRAIRDVAPAAPLIVVGPQFWDAPVPAHLFAIRDAVAAAAEIVGATFVDALGWMQGRPELLGPDAAHPNTAGQRMLADRITPIVELELVRSRPTGSLDRVDGALQFPVAFPADFTGSDAPPLPPSAREGWLAFPSRFPSSLEDDPVEDLAPVA